MALIQVKKCEMCGAEIPVPPSAKEVTCPVCGSTYDVLYGPRQRLKRHAIIISTLADGYVKDTEWPLTVARSTGMAEITSAETNEYYDGKTYCCRKITSAYPGDLFNLVAYVKNIGGKDWIWLFAKDSDTGAQIKNNKGVPFGFQIELEADEEWGQGIDDIVMPDRDFHILVEAGHGKRW